VDRVNAGVEGAVLVLGSGVVVLVIVIVIVLERAEHEQEHDREHEDNHHRAKMESADAEVGPPIED
jgi:hypothetical protein